MSTTRPRAQTVRSGEFERDALLRQYRHPLFTLAMMILLCHISVFAQPSAAIDLYNRANRESARGNLDKAIADYRQALKTSRLRIDEKSNQDFSEGLNRMDSSVEDAAHIIANDTFTAKVYTNCAIVHYRKGQIDEAIADLNAALRINPGLVAAYLARGVARRAKGQFQDALADFDRVLAINGQLVEAYNDRADVRLDMGDFEGALADLSRALVLNPRFPGTYYQLGYARIGQRDFGAAIMNFDKAIQLDSKMAGAYQGRGTAQMARGELKIAIADFDRALAINPKSAEAYENRGLAFLILGKTSKAETNFQRCLSLKPQLEPDLRRRIQLAKELRVGSMR